MRNRWVWLVAGYLFVAVIVVQVRWVVTGWPNYAEIWKFVTAGANGAAPDCYRILEPAIVCAVLTPLLGQQRAIALYQILVGWLFFCLFHRYLRQWLQPGGAFAGTIFMAAAWPASMKQGVPYGGDFLEAIFFTVSLWALSSRRYGYLPLIVAVATLNRESIVFIVPAVFALSLHRHSLWRAVLHAGSVVLAWAVVYGGIRLVLGVRSYYCDVFRADDNLQGLISWLTHPSPFTLQAHLFVLFGIFWVVGLLPLSRRPIVLVKAAWIIPVYLAGAFTLALIGEARILLSLAPVLIPLGLWNLFPDSRADISDSLLEHS